MKPRKFLIAAGLLLASCFLWAGWIEPNQLIVRHEEITMPAEAGFPDGLRIALFSDLHVGALYINREKVRQVVESVQKENPELIAMVGDFVRGTALASQWIPFDDWAGEIGRLHAPLGVFAVLGNVDHTVDPTGVSDALRKHGVRLLVNESVAITKDAKTVWIAGMDDLWRGKADVTKTMAGVNRSEAVILLTHNPDIFDPARLPVGVNLALAGHTHGGQLNLPFWGRTIMGHSDYGERYAAGHIVENEAHMFVTTGIGTTLLPLRFRVPPEIVILTIRANTKAGD